MTMPTCAWCGTPFTASGRRQFHSHACRQVAYRARQRPPSSHIQPTPAALERTVYECPNCEQRYLGQRRCPDYNLYCRRLGPGGPCPHCDEPIAYTDLDH